MSDKTNIPPRRGPIIVSRHGRPALNRSVGPKLAWQEYREWWDQYESGCLAEDQSPPEKLKTAVADVDLVLASCRPRAIETAKWATDGRQPDSHEVFNEAPLPPPRFKTLKYLPKTWNVLARTAWLYGHHLGDETVDEARSRAVGGTGLGLAIAKHILQRHRGELSIRSEPGVGSAFTFWLPAEPTHERDL